MSAKRNLSPMKTLSREYWQEAFRSFSDIRMLAVAAMIVALRVVVKFLKVPLAEGLSLSFDCYVNSIGSLIYGPVVALAVGAVSDTLGCILAPTGPYFLPFILVEMGSGFLFSLFLWRKVLSPERMLAAKFTVNLVCNIVLTSLFLKWEYYLFYGVEKAQAYNLINLTRIVKNLALFPLEGTLILLLIKGLCPPLISLKFLSPKCVGRLETNRIFWLEVGLLLLLSVLLVVFYPDWATFVKAHNLKLL